MTYDPASTPRQFWATPEFALESGDAILNFQQGFIQHGTPEPDGSNVVLVTSSLGGNAHRLDFLIGDGLALDPGEVCAIATDAIGNGVSSSPSNSARQPGLSFPDYGIRDMVRAQRRMLSERFGIDRVHAVVGASMGGMQALQWAVSYPNAMNAIVALVPLDRTPAWTVASNEISRRILMLDPDWNGGDYTAQPEQGWRVAAAFLQSQAARSPEYLDQLCADGTDPISLLDSFANTALANGFDANDWICQTRAYDQHDLGKTPGIKGGAEGALRAITVPMLVMGPSLDLLNPAAVQKRVADTIPKATYVEMPSNRGHMAAAPGDDDDVAQMNAEIGAFLKRHRSHKGE